MQTVMGRDLHGEKEALLLLESALCLIWLEVRASPQLYQPLCLSWRVLSQPRLGTCKLPLGPATGSSDAKQAP